MKLVKRLLIFTCVFTILFFIAIAMYVKFYGQETLQEALQDALKRDVAFSSVSYQFPFYLQARDVRIAHQTKGKKFFEAEKISAQLSFDAMVQQKLIFSKVEVIKPVIMIDKSPKSYNSDEQPDRRYGVVVPPQEGAEENVEQSEQSQDEQQTSVDVKKFILKEGRFQYSNSTIDKDFSFALENVYLSINKIVFPFVQGQTDFNIVGQLVKEGNPLSGSSVKGRGWMDIVRRDLNASIEVVEADGTVGMTAQAISKDNDMNVEGEIKFQNIAMRCTRR